jgi:putative sigma-54 modulation protein
MQTSVTFKNLDPSDNLKSYVKDKLDRFDKYLDNPAEASVVLSVEKFRHMVEINISGDKLNINGKKVKEDMYSAIDMVMDKLEKQIKKSKDKTRKRRATAKQKIKNLFDGNQPISDDTYTSENELKISNIEYKPMDTEEAILQMDLINNNFLVFTNSKTDAVNVLYRRKNGRYGLIQPNE